MKLHTLSIALLCATHIATIYSMDCDSNRQVTEDACSPATTHILDIPDNQGLTPLHKIIYSKNLSDAQRTKFVEKFVRHGANINAPVKAVGRGLKHDNADVGFTPLHVAVFANQSTAVVDTLCNHGARMNAVDIHNRTPISLAVDLLSVGQTTEEQLEMLLNHIPDVVPVLPNPAK